MAQISKNFKLIFFIGIAFLFATNVLAQDSAKANKKEKKTAQRTLYGQASFYSNKFEGRKTASGEIFRQGKLTAACNSLPLGTWIEVTNLRNNKTIIVKTNDRLHPKMKRVVDLTLAAAKKLDFVSSGLTRVKVVVINKNKRK